MQSTSWYMEWSGGCNEWLLQLLGRDAKHEPLKIKQNRDINVTTSHNNVKPAGKLNSHFCLDAFAHVHHVMESAACNWKMGNVPLAQRHRKSSSASNCESRARFADMQAVSWLSSNAKDPHRSQQQPWNLVWLFTKISAKGIFRFLVHMKIIKNVKRTQSNKLEWEMLLNISRVMWKAHQGGREIISFRFFLSRDEHEIIFLLEIFPYNNLPW